MNVLSFRGSALQKLLFLKILSVERLLDVLRHDHAEGVRAHQRLASEDPRLRTGGVVAAFQRVVRASGHAEA